ncbi:hypothetical protein DERP_006928 [Dermatophagoides pteronyssinus]|uniref:Uncharacterized protein n=1 Tax=Dermatophagoides pteronyssinus TaxID=6956 RepID=A0ABQ8ISE4_DERPT|nr:hypothetical protein DERP_006928 [Dermatophagoides pteronyssinus]
MTKLTWHWHAVKPSQLITLTPPASLNSLIINKRSHSSTSRCAQADKNNVVGEKQTLVGVLKIIFI